MHESILYFYTGRIMLHSYVGGRDSHLIRKLASATIGHYLLSYLG
jgi:hypothetical protein